jgi:hypothetical protein
MQLLGTFDLIQAIGNKILHSTNVWLISIRVANIAVCDIPFLETTTEHGAPHQYQENFLTVYLLVTRVRMNESGYRT